MSPFSLLRHQQLSTFLEGFSAETLRALLKLQLEVTGSSLELHSVMQLMANSCMELLRCDGAVIEMQDGPEIIFRAASGIVSPFIDLRLKTDASISGVCIRDAQILNCVDIEIDPRVDRDACRKVGVRSILVSPLRYRSRTVGVLKAVSALPHAFGRNEADVLQALAVSLSAALAHSEEFALAEKRWQELELRTQGLEKAVQERTALIQASEKRLRDLTEALPQLVWSCQPDGKCDYLNQQWVDYTGVPLDQQIGAGWLAKVIHPDDQIRTRDHWIGAVHGLHPYDIEYRIRRHDGVFRWFKARATPMKNERGQITHWFGTCTDVEDHKCAEEALEKALKMRDEFISVASHELKTPLTSLSLHSQQMEREIQAGNPRAFTPERIKSFAGQTLKQTKRLVRLVDDMLDSSRIRSGKLTIQKELIDLGELTRETLDRMKSQFAQSGSPSPSLTSCDSAVGFWDRIRMEQVLSNLLTNAIRYGNKKPVSVHVETCAEAHRLVVADQGIGIPTEHQMRIFEPFERAIESSEISGLGMGLFITREIVQAHGGQIRVESELGKGSSFIVELPREAPLEPLRITPA